MTARRIMSKTGNEAARATRLTRALLGIVLVACSSSGPGPGDGAPGPGGGGPLRITTPPDVRITLPVDNHNLQYQLAATGGTPPYSWRYVPLSEDHLPAETSFSSDGVLSGTPCNSFNDGSPFSLMFAVTDKQNLESSISVLLSIVCCSSGSQNPCQ